MSALVLILADCPQPPLLQAAPQDWPRLPALEYWLTRAQRRPLADVDWRGWLQQRIAREDRAARAASGTRMGASLDDVAGAAPADVIAAAVSADAAPQYWLATPVHWVAGLDTVRLQPQGLLQLDDDEAAALSADFARVFAGSGWSLQATGGRDFLLAGPPLSDCQCDDPALWRGQSPRAGMARGAGAKPLRQLGAEIEMWLHEHPVNRRRNERALLTISALWPWGAGQARDGQARTGAQIRARVGEAPAHTGERQRRVDISAPPAPSGARSTVLLLADDLYAGSLWRLRGAPQAALPERWSNVATEASPAAEVTIVLSWPGIHPAAIFQSWEQHWFAPLLADWRAGRFNELVLLAGRDEFVLSAAARWRFWSRTRPWWQALLA